MEKKLNEYRKEIDSIDTEMKELFLKRMSISKKIGDFKKSNKLEVLDLNREKEIIEKNSSDIDDKKMKEYYIEFYKKIIDISKKHQL